MRKGKYSVLLLWFISLTVIIGGWFFTKMLLDRESRKLLQKKGTVYELPGEESFWESGTDSEEVFDMEQAFSNMSDEMLLEILKAQKKKQVETEQLHEPNETQMNMGQAIMTGINWIDSMAEHGVVPAYWKGINYDNINAKLYRTVTYKEGEDVEDPMLSNWLIRYEISEIECAVLKIHAMSGIILNAMFRMQQGQVQEDLTDEEILLLAFPFLSEKGAYVMQEDDSTFLFFKDLEIYASVQRYSRLIVDKTDQQLQGRMDHATAYDVMVIGLGTNVYNSATTVSKS